MSAGGAVTSELARRRFSELVLPHLDDAYGLARWLTGNRTDAEDVVQDACLRALAALDAAVVLQPRAWLLTVVRNTAFTWLAKNRPKTVVLTDDAQALEAAAARRASRRRTRRTR
jgi:RNA polymerase sigma factor (sigma-70 family)